MNYKKVYYAIINKALRKERTGQRWKGDGNYYEKHHIVPRSLGGLDSDNNLVLLTAKEHYLCHWLLFKSYELNTVERKKMLKAWFMMAAVGDTNRPSINMNDYNRYRNELAKTISDMQIGENNSQYGAHWYTNYITGEYKNIKGPVSKEWVLGKHFQGEYSLIGNPNTRYIHKARLYTFYNPDTLEKIKCTLLDKPANFVPYNQTVYSKLFAYKRWDEYHAGNYKALCEFTKHTTWNAVAKLFKRWIPIYANKTNNGCAFPSNPNLLGIYE